MSIASDPSGEAVAVTPSDTVALRPPRALYVGGAGNIVLRTKNSGTDVTFNSVQAGSILPVRPSFVRATSTTATGIVALY